MGFVSFKTKDSAIACLKWSKNNSKIKALYLNELVYVNLHVSKN